MKARFTTILTLLVLAICLIFLGRHFYLWRENQLKRKELFVYFQKKSEVTRRLPADSVAYLNVYQLKKIYEGLEGTKFYDVLSHWFDTGMSDKQKANPLLGGMLEKTIVDVLGDELGVAIVPSPGGKIDYIAVSHIASGSQFILRLAIASAKNTRTISFNGETIYAFPTKDATYPEVFVYLGDEFAFSSSNLERLKQSARAQGSGPSFLANLPLEAVPQDTFLFLETKNPQFSIRGYAESHRYHLRVEGASQISSHLPEYNENDQTIFRVQTNGTEIWNQPAASYSIEAVSGEPLSHLLLTFSDPKIATSYSDFVLNTYNAKTASGGALEIINKKGFECYRYLKNEKDQFVCRGPAAVLLARGPFNIATFGFEAKNISSQKLPLIVRSTLHRDRIGNYFDKVAHKDWSHFSDAKEFYFLSCIQQLSGAIDGSNNEVRIDLE